MEIVLKHSVLYTNKKDVPVVIVAKSLLANERLIQESIRLLADCFDNLEIDKVTVKVNYVSNASPLKEIFALGLFLTYQNELEEEVPELIKMLTGYTVPESANTLVTVLVLMAAIYVIDEAARRLFPGKSNDELKKEYERKLEELSNLSGIGKDQLNNIVIKRFTEGKIKSLFRKTHDFFMPAKLEPDIKIEADGSDGISSAAIAEIPNDVDFEQEQLGNTYEITAATIEIHRADTDYIDQGWVAVIEEASDKRKKMVLSPDIDPAKLYGKRKVRGNVVVIEERDATGEFAPKEYHLMKLIK